MHREGWNVRYWLLAAVLLLVTTGAMAAGNSWVAVGADGKVILQETGAGEVPQVSVVRSDAGGLAAQFELPGFGVATRSTPAGEFLELHWTDASVAGEIGEPALPVIRRLLVAPPGASVTIRVLESGRASFDLDEAGLPWRVMPVQPPIEKIPGAKERAEFRFNAAAYTERVPLPSDRASLTELGIVRGQRLFLLELRPIAYEPDARRLLLWPELRAEVEFRGGRAPAADLGVLPGLAGSVLNPELLAGRSTKGSGNFLIIVDGAFETGISSFAAAKASQGFNVNVHTVNGDTNTAIKSYIEGLWGGPDSPDYILLVGDTDTIPHWTGGGEGYPDTDLPYACMDGVDDWYPDIALGRFPVRSAAQLTAVVDKTLYYEAGVFSDPGYKMRAVFMASTDNYTVSEGTHNWVISNYMDPNGYTSDKLYTYTYGATTQDTRDAFNDGRFFGIYSGHGGTTSWADGPPFSQSDVNGLTNAEMYPVVYSFACVTGSYVMDECFTETWIRAADKGAVAVYGSSVNSYWTEDDVLEKRLFDSIFDDGDDVPDRVGPVWNDTRLRYLAEMGSGATTRRYFEMYNLLGDPALLYFGTEQPPTGLQVSPYGGLSSEGNSGGPFAPDSVVYTLENLNTTGLDYSVTHGESWVSVSDSSGYLPGGATTDVTVSINSNANGLSNGTYTDTVNFINTTDHDGDTTRNVTLTVGVPGLQYAWTMDFDPGWTAEGLWDWGQPTGGGGQYGGPDPTGGYTGSNVYGYNLAGDYENGLAETHLTTTAFDCSGLSQTSVKFWRWLGVESPTYDHATLSVSNDGVNWSQVWTNGAAIADSAWTQQEFDISAVADGQSTVYLRWTMGPTDSSWQYCGWNIDDVEIWGLGGAQSCVDDGDCDNGLYCDGAETCVDTVCQAGVPVDCDDGVACTADSCNEGSDTCDNLPDDTFCADGLYCNGAETCDPVLDCLNGTNPCPTGYTCDEANDVCIPCDGDGVCDAGEDCNTCPSDCDSGVVDGWCGNGVCEPGLGEDCLSCESDCNGKQVGKLSNRFCCGDGDGQNPADCGDARCSTDGWECSTSAGVPYCCGDGECTAGGEDSLTCEIDCPIPVCGDGSCDPDEDPCSCPADCGTPPSTETDCTDGIDNDCDGFTDTDDSDCQCLVRGEACSTNDECCSDRCFKGYCK